MLSHIACSRSHCTRIVCKTINIHGRTPIGTHIFMYINGQVVGGAFSYAPFLCVARYINRIGIRVFVCMFSFLFYNHLKFRCQYHHMEHLRAFFAYKSMNLHLVSHIMWMVFVNTLHISFSIHISIQIMLVIHEFDEQMVFNQYNTISRNFNSLSTSIFIRYFLYSCRNCLAVRVSIACLVVSRM